MLLLLGFLMLLHVKRGKLRRPKGAPPRPKKKQVRPRATKGKTGTLGATELEKRIEKKFRAMGASAHGSSGYSRAQRRHKR